jgi:superoxide dismutase, Cu-Zn family
MIKFATILLLTTAAAGAGAASTTGPAHAVLRNAAGAQLGTARLTGSHGGVRVRIDVRGLARGRYGVHIHAVGRCEGPDFTSAGAHWNPTARQHGSLNPQGHHLGDLPNLEVGANGRGRVEFGISGATLGRIVDVDGAAIVIHAAADDYRTDPSGNSGARIACGILEP